MTLNLRNVRIDSCGTGISAPKDADINADGLEITNTKRGIELRDLPGLLQKLGLPPETPQAELIEAYGILKGAASLPQEEREKKFRETNLVKRLGVTADLTTLGTALLSSLANFLGS